MRRIRSNRGAGLIDVMLTLFLLGMAGVIFAATYPTCFKATKQAQEYKVAVAIAQNKMEQLRAMNYESLTQTLLAPPVIDSGSGTTGGGYSFTSVDAVPTQLPSGTGSFSVQSIGSDIKKITITVSWQGRGATRSVVLTTLFADKRTRKMG